MSDNKFRRAIIIDVRHTMDSGIVQHSSADGRPMVHHGRSMVGRWSIMVGPWPADGQPVPGLGCPTLGGGRTKRR